MIPLITSESQDDGKPDRYQTYSLVAFVTLALDAEPHKLSFYLVEPVVCGIKYLFQEIEAGVSMPKKFCLLLAVPLHSHRG